MRPTQRLASFAAIPLSLSIAALVWPALMGPAWVALIVVLVLMVQDLWSSLREPALEVRRVIPERARRGHPCEFEYHLKNPSDRPWDVTLLDELPADLGGDQRVGPLVLAAGAVEVIHQPRTPRRRGLRELGPVYANWRSVYGLFRRSASDIETSTLAVLPNPGLNDDREALLERSLLERAGIQPRRPRGEGLEFESMREYVYGDDPRHIDWRASARSGGWIVRQHQVERNHTVMVAVDSGRLMSQKIDGVAKLDHALDATIALAHASRGCGDRMGLLAFDRELRALVRPEHPRAASAQLLEATLALQPTAVEPRYQVLLETLGDQQKKRALVVVLTDFVEGASSVELEECLSVLARRHMVLLVALRDRIFERLEHARPQIRGQGIYENLVLQDLAMERERALLRMRRLGVQVLDLDPAQISVPVVNRYLAIREAERL